MNTKAKGHVTAEARHSSAGFEDRRSCDSRNSALEAGEGKEMDSTLDLSEVRQHCLRLDVSLVKRISMYDLEENKCALFKATKSVAIRYNSHRKLTQVRSNVVTSSGEQTHTPRKFSLFHREQTEVSWLQCITWF